MPQPDRKPTHLLQFVGEQLAFDPIDCVPYRWSTEDMSQSQDEAEAEAEDDTDSTRCGGDDLNYMARYRVLKTIKGETGDTVDFIASGWTSFYAESRHALLYVLVSPDGALLPPGLAVSVYPTVDGDWASCDNDDGSELVEFADNLVFGRTDGMSAHGIAERFPSSDYAIIGDEAFCIRGRRLPALAQDLERGIGNLRDEGFPNLP
ncbi:MAG: hypothetical protein KDI66_13205 [Xanthomonadales bacterium]|nr:hypothetical protein [Xanthomonadales bacterium]